MLFGPEGALWLAKADGLASPVGGRRLLSAWERSQARPSVRCWPAASPRGLTSNLAGFGPQFHPMVWGQHARVKRIIYHSPSLADCLQRPVHRMQPKFPLIFTVAAGAALAASPSHGLGFERPHAARVITNRAIPLPLAPSLVLAAASLVMDVQATVADVGAEPALALEQQVQALLVDAKRQQEQLSQVRYRLVAAEAANSWLPWMVLGLLGAGGLLIWLALRVSRLQRDQERQSWVRPDNNLQNALRADSSPGGGVSLLSPEQPLLSNLAPATAEAAPLQLMAAPAASDETAAGLHTDRPSVAAEYPMGTGLPARSVSVEELLDLDQQVDFFMVLGKEQAAIDLLLSHVRSTGGTSALPYFKLLEIYRQQGDQDAYERTRERFTQRFNATAPDWSGDLTVGLSLEQYPDVLLRLQQVWPQPRRAVAELESLLLRSGHQEPFDLPAYREILLLHALVSDLPGLSAAPVAAGLEMTQAIHVVPTERRALAEPYLDKVASDSVDFLLPMDGMPADAALRRPRLSERTGAQAMLAEWVFSRTAKSHSGPSINEDGFPASGVDESPWPVKLDLDLSDFAPAPREFTRPAAFTDIDMRRDSRRSDMSTFDDSGLPPPLASRR